MKEPEIESWDQLKPADYNPRKIESYAAEGLSNSLKEFGDISGIVWNKRTGNVVAGHQRLDQLKKMGAQIHQGKILLGEREFKIRVVDWPIGREKAANVAANNPHISGEWAENLPDVLGDILAEIGDQDYEALGFSGLDDVKFSANLDDITEDEAPEPPKNPVTKLGDVWTLGDHTLVCGDCRSTSLGMVAGALVTDPPYGVSYVGKTKDKLTIDNDNLPVAELSAFVSAVFDAADRATRPGAYWYATVPAGPLHLVFAGDWEKRGVLRQIMVWVKDSMVLGHSEYHYKHEPILYGWKPGGDRLKNSDRTRTTVWEHARPTRSAEHPTMKPVSLFAQMITDGTKKLDTVFDPFLGSGTTLIACEQLDRKCFGVELAPEYCDVVIERWQNLTGSKATRKAA
jgi:DNA modification methylase